jgi:hypothetical protein
MILARLSGTSREFLEFEASHNLLPELRKTLHEAGIELNNKPDAPLLICVNHNRRAYKEFIRNGGNAKNAILIRLEPDAVYPKQYTHKIESKYGLILSPGAVQSESVFFGWPYKYHLNPAKPVASDPSLLEVLDKNLTSSLFHYENWNKREHILTMIASNKVSPMRSANYELRRGLAKKLPNTVLSVYGALWTESISKRLFHRIAVFVAALKQGTMPNLTQIYGNLFAKYSSARGPVVDKHELLKRSKFSLVVENSNRIVTEKFFDSVINGSIPIYVGANLQLANLPSSMAFEINGSANEIFDVIENYSRIEIEQKLESISNFLFSKNFRENWLDSKVYEKIGLEISQYILSNFDERSIIH